MRKSILAGVAAGALLAAGGIAAVDLASEPAEAQGGGFTLTTGQLKINQNISSAAVRRSNRSLNYLAPIRTQQTDNADDGSNGVRPLSTVPGSGQGWTNSQIANEAINSEKIAPGGVTSSDLADNSVQTSKIENNAVTGEKIADGAVSDSKLSAALANRLPKWINKVDNGANNTSRASSPAYSVVRLAAGNYRADFGDTNLTQCSWNAVGAVDVGLSNGREIQTAIDVTDNTRLFVVTRNSAGALIESGFAAQAFC